MFSFPLYPSNMISSREDKSSSWVILRADIDHMYFGYHCGENPRRNSSTKGSLFWFMVSGVMARGGLSPLLLRQNIMTGRTLWRKAVSSWWMESKEQVRKRPGRKYSL